MRNILIVLSAADSWTRADGLYATGVWAQELVDIDETFAQAGVAVDIATPGGVRATIDQRRGRGRIRHRDNAPSLLADTLRKRGARYEQGPNWQPFFVRDGNLLTGQNPASSKPLADAVVAALA